LVRAAQVAGGLGTLRAKHPPATSFWWYLDQELNRRRRHALRRFIVSAVSIVAIVAGALWAVNTFFPPDPAAVLMVETTNTLDQYIATQRWEEALQVVENTRTTLPDQPDLVIWQVVFNEQLGRTAAAAAALEEAHAMMGDPTLVWVRLGTDRLQVGNLDGAEQAAEEARALNPDEAQVYFLLGSIAETRGDVQAAIAYFDRTASLALDTNPQLGVIARVRMGTLLQSPGNFAPATSEATPTP
jgi:predicted Zn-dependent protease